MRTLHVAPLWVGVICVLARAGFAAPGGNEGDQRCDRFVAAGKHGVSYHVCYPPGFSADKKYPVLILFSAGGNGRGILDSFREAVAHVGWIGVGCDGFKNKMDEDLGREMFAEALPDIEKRLPIDPDRMYLGGMSGGAWRAYHVSAWFDRNWKGILACGGWLGGEEYYNLKYPRKMAVAMINGDKDSGANSWSGRDSKVLDRRGCRVKVFDFPGGHAIAPAEVLKEAIAWVRETSEK